MAGVGEAASLLTLLGTAISIGKQSVELIRNIEDAPYELQRVATILNSLPLILEQYSSLRNDLPMSAKYRDSLQSALATTEIVICRVQKAYRHSEQKTNLRKRLRWAFLEQSETKKLLDQLQNSQVTLLCALKPLELDTLMLMSRDITTLVSSVNKQQQPVALSPNGTRSIDFGLLSRNQKKYYRSCRQWAKGQISSSTSHSWVEAFGLFWTASSWCNPIHTIWALSLRVESPAALGCRAFLASMLLRQCCHCFLGLSFSLKLLTITNVIPMESEIVIACTTGDAVLTKYLLLTRQARPNDIVQDGDSLLSYAIQSGNLETVDCLLYEGAHADLTVDDCQTSPLQLAIQFSKPDICRTLIRHGADTDHVDTQGWTSAHYIWARTCRQPFTSEILSILASLDSLNLDCLDQGHWSALHRASVFGSAEDMAFLIRHGGDPHARLPPLNSTPLHLAAKYLNDAVVQELVQEQYGLDVNEPDERGWTPLHLAAYHDVQATFTIRCLVQSKANPRLLSTATLLAPKRLQNKCFSPGVAARTFGPEIYANYVRVLQEEGLGDVVKDEIDETEGEFFWDAIEF